MKINRVTVVGDLVTVERELDGITKTVRRHIQNYEQLAKEEKKKVWRDIAGLPQEVYTHQNIFKWLIGKLKVL